MHHLRRVFAFLAALIVLSVGGSALAQTATVKINKVGVVHSIPRTNNRNVSLLNRADCTSNDIVSFPVSLTNRGAYTLQAWVGTNCTDIATRTNISQTTCWKVYDQVPSGNNPNTPTLDIPVRALIAGYTCGASSSSSSSGSAGASGSSSSGGASGTAGESAAGGSTSTVTSSCITPINSLISPGIEACTQNSVTTAGATALTLYVMLVDAASALQGSDTWAGSFKFVGPPAPDQFSLGIGGNLLVANFKYTTDPSDQTGNGFLLFCDPPAGRDVAVDAGLVEPDASAGPTFTCGTPASQVLIQGQLAPDKDSMYRCGSTSSKNARSVNATNLVNGVAYNVAVAAVDTYDNTGPLSELQCEVPQPITGFFKGYRDAGGEAGGGFCSFSRHREPLTLVAVLGFASYLVFRRRRAA